MSSPSVTPRGGVAAALTVVYIAWGSTFVAMRVAVRSLPPAVSLVSASGLALGYLIVFGSLLGYSTYEWLLHHASSQLASTYAFVCPLVAVILGWWLLGEQVSGRTLLAAAAISVGVALIMLHPRAPEPEPGRDETGDQPRKPPAARLPAPTRRQRTRPAGNAPSDSEHEPGPICCCDTPAP